MAYDCRLAHLAAAIRSRFKAGVGAESAPPPPQQSGHFRPNIPSGCGLTLLLAGAKVQFVAGGGFKTPSNLKNQNCAT